MSEYAAYKNSVGTDLKAALITYIQKQVLHNESLIESIETLHNSNLGGLSAQYCCILGGPSSKDSGRGGVFGGADVCARTCPNCFLEQSLYCPSPQLYWGVV